MDGDDQPISAKTKKSFSIEAEESIDMKTKTHTFDGDVIIKGELRVKKDIKTDADGFKPTGPEWKPGNAGVPLSDQELVAKSPLADRIRLGPDGEIIIDADLTVSGNLRVTGTITAKGFKREDGTSI
jgi:hypothetical protein